MSTALRPKWLALLGLVVVVVVLFGWLGLWQLNVARSKGTEEALQKIGRMPEVPVDDVIRPQTPIAAEHVGRAVRATGRYDARHQVAVVDRRLDDRNGVWVLTPLVVDASGARLAVVRGFVPSGTAVPPPPTGTVTVHGTIEPQEGPPQERRSLPEGQWQTVNLASAVNIWPGDLYDAFVLAAREEPPAPAQITAVPPPKIDVGGINWRNAAYAVQWWIFAGFVVYVWWRSVRDDHALRLAAEAGAGPDPHGDDQTDPSLTSAGGPTR